MGIWVDNIFIKVLSEKKKKKKKKKKKTYTTNHFNQPSTYLSITLLKIIMSKFVDYTVFNPEQIVASTPEQKQIPNQT
ncbi:hypothetical protein, partial [Escherichia coli]|uniref:hypothetical protein n=1 Tax=Escherichia coli TaxID=562 RepID=UPI0020C0574F